MTFRVELERITVQRLRRGANRIPSYTAFERASIRTPCHAKDMFSEHFGDF